jgi:hypothetical protein
MLNIAYGELDWYSWVDTDYDGAGDMYLYEALGQAAIAYDAADYETAKSICDSINNM